MKKGYKFSEASKKKMSETKKRMGYEPRIKFVGKGKDNPMYGKHKSNETKEKLRLAHKGKHHSPKSEFSKGHIPWNKGKIGTGFPIGEKHPNWGGGITPLYRAIRNSLEYQLWADKIRKKDYFTCQGCKKIGNNLHVDHIISLRQIVISKNIKTLQDARECKQLWDISNGRVLCKPCHLKTDTWGSKARKKIFPKY